MLQQSDGKIGCDRRRTASNTKEDALSRLSGCLYAKTIGNKHAKRPHWPSGRRFLAFLRIPMPEECFTRLPSDKSHGRREDLHEHEADPGRYDVSSHYWYPRYRRVFCSDPGRRQSTLHDDVRQCDVAWRYDQADSRHVSLLPDTDHRETPRGQPFL